MVRPDVTDSPTPRTQLPPHLLPVLYFGVAHVALALACLAVALDQRGVYGFFYHSRVLAVVPPVTLGWITVCAHAHLAALGWATMMVIGVAYRLLPMTLPAAMPSGPRLWLSVTLLQTGVTGLFVTLL